MASEKYVALFVRGVSGGSQVVGQTTFRPDSVKDGLSYKGRTHILDLNEPAYRRGNAIFYIVDLDKGQRLVGKASAPASPKLMDAIFRKEIVKQLVSGLQGAGDWRLALIIGLMGGGMGLLGGILVGAFVL